MPTSDSLSTFHLIMFAITGLTRLAYVLKTIAWLRPDPFPFWITGILDRIIAAPIFALAAAAGRKSAKQAFDEGHIMDKRRGEVHAFWIALMLNAIFGVFMATGAVALPTAFVRWAPSRGRIIYCCSTIMMQ